MQHDEIIGHVADAIDWIRRHRTDKNGRQLSASRVVTEAGLQPQQADQIIKRRQKSVNAETAVKLAKRWNCRVGWILTGVAPEEPFEAADVSSAARAHTLAGYEAFERRARVRIRQHQSELEPYVWITREQNVPANTKIDDDWIIDRAAAIYRGSTTKERQRIVDRWNAEALEQASVPGAPESGHIPLLPNKTDRPRKRR